MTRPATPWFRAPITEAYLGSPPVHEARRTVTIHPVRPHLSPAERLRIALLMLVLLAVPAVGVWEWWKGMGW